MGLLSRKRKSRTKGVSDPAKLLITEHEKVERLFAELDAAGGAVERQGLIAQLDAELSAHTAKEEALLYPFVAKHVRNGDALVHDAHREHGLARQALADLVSMDPGDDRVPAVAAHLRGLVAGHVKEEEKVLFPALDAAATNGDLATLRSELEAAKFARVEHPLEAPPGAAAAPAASAATKKVALKRVAAAKKAPANEPASKKAAPRKAAAKKAAPKKMPAKKAPARKVPAKKAPAKRAR